ncbi:MAG: 50S ribosomal protein L11 methyltransferase [Acidobacteria bacterium]|nr:50S ribosomal protein L11 methyltransferase [Acidobacteriota bacterium]
MELLDFHESLLSDEGGQRKFREAIARTVQNGATVLDLGTGTGIHSIFACQAGARRVYAVDEHAFIVLARRIAEANGCSARIQFLHGAVEDLQLPEKVDVIVGHHGLPSLLELLPLAKRRFLKPEGALIPSAIQLFCAPLESSPAHQRAVAYWEQPHLELDLSPVRSFAASNAHEWKIRPEEFLGEPASLGTMDFAQVVEPAFSGEAEFRMARSGILHGVGMWFVQWLTKDICIDTTPPSPFSPRIWNNLFLPLEVPQAVDAGEVARIRVRTGPGGWGEFWKWEVDLRDRTGGMRSQLSQSSFAQQLLTRDMLRKQAPDYQPSLSARGEAARFVLCSCDGRQSLAWIEQEVAQRFPESFATAAEAAGFVANLVARHAR